jgi:hypothetical protein
VNFSAVAGLQKWEQQAPSNKARQTAESETITFFMNYSLFYDNK